MLCLFEKTKINENEAEDGPFLKKKNNGEYHISTTYAALTKPWFKKQVKHLIKIPWHLTAPTSTPDFLSELGLNLALCLVTSCYSHQTACWRPIFGWGEIPWALVTPVPKSHLLGWEVFMKKVWSFEWPPTFKSLNNSDNAFSRFMSG